MAEIAKVFKQARFDTSLVVLEGFHAIKHAIRFGAELEVVVGVDWGEVMKMTESLAPDIKHSLTSKLQIISPKKFESLTELPHRTGLMAVGQRAEYDLKSLLDDTGQAPIVLLEDPRNLGNLGAAIRVAAAGGAAGVVVLGNQDPWQSQVIRGAAGLQYAVPVVSAQQLPETNRPIIAIDPDGRAMRGDDFPPGSILAFGTERAGLSEDIIKRADQKLAISMKPGVSSLNLASAVAVTLYIGKTVV